jgi:hypothetical protein
MLRCGSKRCLEARYADRVATPSHLPSNLDARRSLFLRPRIASLPSTLNGDPSGSPGGKPFRLKSTARVALAAWGRRGQGAAPCSGCLRATGRRYLRRARNGGSGNPKTGRISRRRIPDGLGARRRRDGDRRSRIGGNRANRCRERRILDLIGRGAPLPFSRSARYRLNDSYCALSCAAMPTAL